MGSLGRGVGSEVSVAAPEVSDGSAVEESEVAEVDDLDVKPIEVNDKVDLLVVVDLEAELVVEAAPPVVLG